MVLRPGPASPLARAHRGLFLGPAHSRIWAGEVYSCSFVFQLLYMAMSTLYPPLAPLLLGHPSTTGIPKGTPFGIARSQKRGHAFGKNRKSNNNHKKTSFFDIFPFRQVARSNGLEKLPKNKSSKSQSDLKRRCL